MELSTFLSCLGILAIGSIWAFGAMMKTVGNRMKWDPKSTFWRSALLYGFLGYIIPALLLYLTEDESFLYLIGLLILVSPVYAIVNAVLKRRESRNPQPFSPEDHIAKPPVEEAPSSRVVPQKGSARIFVSYRRSDSADVAGRIYDRLVGRFGKNPIFKDVDSIPLGLDFKEYLDRKVGECDVLLAIIGDRWLEAVNASGKKRLDDPADFVRIEIESALERGIPVIPLLVRDAHMPVEESLPPGLRKLVYRNGIPIRPDPDFHRDMDRLITALEKYV